MSDSFSTLIFAMTRGMHDKIWFVKFIVYYERHEANIMKFVKLKAVIQQTSKLILDGVT
jgi:hypothetical protein